MIRGIAVGLLIACTVGCRDAPPSAEAVAGAQKIWDERCSNCHGPKGMGDGPGAAILPVKPRVLADSGWQARVTDEHIANVITEGGQPFGLDAQMAANPDLKTKPEILRALVRLVREL